MSSWRSGALSRAGYQGLRSREHACDRSIDFGDGLFLAKRHHVHAVTPRMLRISWMSSMHRLRPSRA